MVSFVSGGAGGFGGDGVGSPSAAPAASYSAPSSGSGGKGSSTPKGAYLGGPSISAEDFNAALRSDAATAYKQGPTQTTYSGLSDASKGAIAGLNSAATANAGILNQANSYNQGLLNSGGLTAGQRATMDTVGNVGNGFGSIASSAVNPSLTEDELMSVARGDQFGQAAPGYDALRRNAIDDTRTAINRQFGASGRFGSGGQMIDLGRGITDAVAGLDYQNYQNDIARQERALAAIEAQRQQGVNNRMSALTGQQNAAQMGFTMGQTGTANAMSAADRAPEMYQNMLLPYQTQIQANALLDADAAARAAFDPNYLHLAKYQGLLGNNAAAPQPAKQPGALDYIGAGAGLLTALL